MSPFVTLLFAISAGLVLHLWLWRPGKPGQKILWTIVLAIPFLGAIVNFAFYEPPSVQPEHEQAREDPNLDAASRQNDFPSHHG